VNFDPDKDYYGILGVTSSAEMAVIKAAYKALAGIYHPDRNTSQSAKEKMQIINEAWDVLSCPDKKKKYDEAFAKPDLGDDFFTEDDAEDWIRSYFEEDWTFALSYYPNIEIFADRLGKISSRLGVAYKAVLVSEKKFKDAELIAKKMEKEFLERYFGSNHRIQAIVATLIFDLNDKKMLKELNSAISILGTDDPTPIIKRFQNMINLEYELKYEAEVKARSEYRKAKGEAWPDTAPGLTVIQSISVMLLLAGIFYLMYISVA
jgi:curved DNA-binding protein CbpA